MLALRTLRTDATKSDEFNARTARTKPSERVTYEELAERSVLRILVVDDNPDVALSLGLLLQMSGYEVFTAHMAWRRSRPRISTGRTRCF